MQVLVALLLGAALGLWMLVLLIHGLARRGRLTSSPFSRSRWAIVRSLSAIIPAPDWFRKTSPAQKLALLQGGLSLSEDEFGSLRWLVALCGFVGALILGIARSWDLLGWFLGLATISSSYLAPLFWIRWRKEQRVTQLELALPDLMDRLRFGLEAGLGFEPALRRAAGRFPGVLGEEIRRLLRQLDLGYPRSLAMIELANRNPSISLRGFVSSINQADRLGSSLTRILQIESTRLRAERQRRAEEASRRLPILIVFPLVFFFLPALLVVYLAPPLLHLLLAR
jgi:tight adherence protein C